MANSTPDTPAVSETKLAALKMDQLRAHARKLGIDETDELHKPELLAKVKDYHYAQAHGGKRRNGSGARASIPRHASTPASCASTGPTSCTNPSSWPRSRTTTPCKRRGSTAHPAAARRPPATRAPASCRG